MYIVYTKVLFHCSNINTGFPLSSDHIKLTKVAATNCSNINIDFPSSSGHIKLTKVAAAKFEVSIALLFLWLTCLKTLNLVPRETSWKSCILKVGIDIYPTSTCFTLMVVCVHILYRDW
jgi:hypothetical protein